MNIPQIVFIVILVLILLWALLLQCRHGHPAWEILTRFRYAHRGLHSHEQGVPENSLKAFHLAAQHGYGAELDVHLTADGRLAVIHDNSLLRTAGADVNASELTAEELSRYRLEGTDERIPFLEEVLPIFEGVSPLIVELKVDNGNSAALAQATCEMLDKFHVDYCVESFHPQAIQWLRRNRPDVCRGQLSQNFLKGEHTGLGFAADFAMTHLLTSFLTLPDFIAYNHQHRKRLNLKLARLIWQVKEVSWTIRTPEDLKKCEDKGCLSIFEQFEP